MGNEAIIGSEERVQIISEGVLPAWDRFDNALSRGKRTALFGRVFSLLGRHDRAAVMFSESNANFARAKALLPILKETDDAFLSTLHLTVEAIKTSLTRQPISPQDPSTRS